MFAPIHAFRFLLYAVMAVVFFGCQSLSSPPMEPEYCSSRIVFPGLYLEKYITSRSGAGAFDTGTDYALFLTDSNGHRLELQPVFEDEYFDFHLNDSLLLVKKIGPDLNTYDTSRGFIIKMLDSTVYNLAKLGFKLPKAAVATSKQKRLALQMLAKDMVFVKGGGFTMGSNWSFSNMPIHQDSVLSFYICKHEVTQVLWQSIMNENPSCFLDCLNCPVENVSWDAVQIFITRLNQLTHQSFRLPTETEWEFAAQGGIGHKTYKYSGGDSLSLVAWHDDNSSNKTHPVGKKLPNSLGLYDMSGNVNEWCSSWMSEGYSPSTEGNGMVTGRLDTTCKVVRGSSWCQSKYDARPTDRQRRDKKWGRSYCDGFRLVR